VPQILYRDEALVAIAKPAGRLVIPGRGAAATEPVLRDEVAALVGGDVWVVHRLDRGTSGVLLFALTPEAHRALSIAFERHRVEKRYWALCRGALAGAGEVDRALVPVRHGRVRVARAGEDGKPSRSRWRALERFGAGEGALTAVEWRPLSGRLHQVRAHAAFLGHPLAVDPDYGGAIALRVRDLVGARADADDVVIARVPLHAAALAFAHPTTGARLEIEAPLPEDLQRALALLRGQGLP
jgi:tRNA pseudouridine32 synthase/23S rRNA pseudouridine746 synthase/23S rRNA pseudouridine955/2504/2580 synthase